MPEPSVPSVPRVSPARAIGVVGAGTMGSGIAQLAARSGARTLLHDPLTEALQRGAVRARDGLAKEAAKGRLKAEEADAAAARIQTVDALEAMAECELVIEAAPERLELKHELYARLAEIVSTECILASNTSSLPITAIASAVPHPERVVGMHFFNPAPLMRLLEVVAGALSDERSLALADATGRAMGKDTIRAADGPGFLVNRCNRPFGLEALRLLGERIADVQTIDRIVRLGGGFRMGPFELSDLVGVDTGFDVALSFHELSFGEPRWRPSPIQAQRVAAGLHGRKTGRGYYDYSRDPHRPPDPDPPPGGAGAIVQGEGPVADALRARAHDGTGPTIAVGGLGGTVAGEPFYALVPLGLVEVTGDAGEAAFQGLGLHTARVRPAPGGVLGRIACQLVNESAFALGEGVGSARDIDTGMTLGLNHPRGPLAWGDTLGLDTVLATLEALWEEYREERYRPAPVLRRLVREGRLGHASGAGFFDYRSHGAASAQQDPG
ncbi:MAG TPA: 3-hydroxyacyl-CoA dehydrogenase NAD-binding domain-containing protein [Solirubrobacteraceae bacterium]|nr:3-hydroxyacyl-CoA dehydrogenase NAD-binding domain-containing protein [Solirubrobacteraceae bacterium]